MIVPMSKITLLVSRADQEKSLKMLRKLGVVHINTPRNLISDDISGTEELMERTDKALHMADAVENPGNEIGLSGKELTEELNEISEFRDDLSRRREELSVQADWYAKWGHISLADIRGLEKKKYFIRLYEGSRNVPLPDTEDGEFFEVGGSRDRVLLALVTRDAGLKPALKEETFPTMEEKEVREEITEIDAKLARLDEKVREFAGGRDKIVDYRTELMKKLRFAQVRDGMADEGAVMVLQGFIPAEETGSIKNAAERQGWGYVLDEPAETDIQTPTLIRTSRFVNIISPVFDLMGTTPGYREYDISLWFLIFFSLFFAMIIGDAGYGLLFIVLTASARIKNRKAPGEPFFLMYLLGGATMVWGAISGTWFGSQEIAQIPFLSRLIIPQVSSFRLGAEGFNDNQNFMIYLCFIIGAVHLTIAHLMNAWKARKSLDAFGQLGWALMVWGLFYLAKNLVLGIDMPAFAVPFLAVGFLLALFLSDTSEGIMKGVAATAGNLPLNVISGFSDVVSYLRLFAVGYASVVVAYSFNDMAVGAGIDGVVAGLVAALILFLGHALNIVLGAMSIIVHGVRLNLLEFSGHLGMEWSGIRYEPFKD